MLGFNFYERSPRYIDPVVAASIVASVPSSVECVGVFVNEASASDVRRKAERAGVKTVQLHGDEPPEFCMALEDYRPIKALRIGSEKDLSEVSQYAGMRILLDSSSEVFGGTGRRFDWTLARKVRAEIAYLILAGGLDAQNVEQAILEVAPNAVDACSRLESIPGKKDRDEVARFIAQAHAVGFANANEKRAGK